MARRPLAAREPDLRGLRVVVLGLGKSGLAAVRLALRHGARVTVADARSEERLGEAAARARTLGAEVRAGGHPATLVEGADLLVLSPGVPRDVEPVGAALRGGVPVWGEVELAARFCRGAVIGITGSNGKSTCTAMTGTILRGAGLAGGTGGNLATPFCDLLEHDADDAIHAVELSSFQLESVHCLRPRVAAILNLSPDHLDRYPDYAAYGAAKARLLELQRESDFAILNADDPDSRRFEVAVRGRLHRFSTSAEVERGAFLRRDRLVLRLDSGESELLDFGELAVRGVHNAANALAAALACALVGCAATDIAGGLRAFRALPHRLEHVGTARGVDFYDDSKATNPASTARAVTAFPRGSVHLILGGRDKGADWGPLLDLVARDAREVLLVGEAAQMLARRLAGRVPVVECGTVGRAVETGLAAARPGEVVLLSPGCASFDQYRNFEERGEDFRTRATALMAGGKGDA